MSEIRTTKSPTARRSQARTLREVKRKGIEPVFQAGLGGDMRVSKKRGEGESAVAPLRQAGGRHGRFIGDGCDGDFTDAAAWSFVAPRRLPPCRVLNLISFQLFIEGAAADSQAGGSRSFIPAALRQHVADQLGLVVDDGRMGCNRFRLGRLDNT